MENTASIGFSVPPVAIFNNKVEKHFAPFMFLMGCSIFMCYFTHVIYMLNSSQFFASAGALAVISTLFAPLPAKHVRF